MDHTVSNTGVGIYPHPPGFPLMTPSSTMRLVTILYYWELSRPYALTFHLVLMFKKSSTCKGIIVNYLFLQLSKK